MTELIGVAMPDSRTVAEQDQRSAGDEDPPPGGEGQYGDRRSYEELQRRYEALRRCEERRESLLQMLVHDLDNSLMAASGFGQLAVEEIEELDVSSREVVGSLTRQMVASLRDMHEMLSGLLKLSRLEAGNLPVESTSVDAALLCAGESDKFRALAEIAHVELVLSADRDELLLTCDERLLRRTIDNLLDNALKHASSLVELLIEDRGEFVALGVRNDGPAIPEDFSELVFQKFFQLPASEGGRSMTRGLGMGLTFCRLAVEAQGGLIFVEDPPAGGTCFWVLLPHTRRETSQAG